jgi:hypothetical protein
MQNDFVMAAAGFLLFLIVLFLIGREIVCWYLKINLLLNVFEEMRGLMRVQVQVQQQLLESIQKIQHTKQSSDIKIESLFVNGYSDEEYLKKSLFKKTNQSSFTYFALPNGNFVFPYEKKYYLFDSKEKLDEALKVYSMDKAFPTALATKEINEQQSSEIRKSSSDLEIEQARNRWKGSSNV